MRAFTPSTGTVPVITLRLAVERTVSSGSVISAQGSSETSCNLRFSVSLPFWAMRLCSPSSSAQISSAGCISSSSSCRVASGLGPKPAFPA